MDGWMDGQIDGYMAKKYMAKERRNEFSLSSLSGYESARHNRFIQSSKCL